MGEGLKVGVMLSAAMYPFVLMAAERAEADITRKNFSPGMKLGVACLRASGPTGHHVYDR